MLHQKVAKELHLAVVKSHGLNLKYETLLVMADFLPSFDKHVLTSMIEDNLEILLDVDHRVAFDETVQLVQ